MGARAISPMGHVRMMAAVQPFLSGAISKTVNLPETATVEEIEDVYVQGWKMGLKALAVYRDNCKVGQPLSDGGSTAKDKAADAAQAKVEKVIEYRPVRRRLPKRRSSQTTSFAVGGAEGYLTAGTYDTGELGEIFLKFGKQGSTLAGVMDAFSIAVSIGLQYGVPLETFVEKFTNLRFEPAGMTDDPDVRMAQSIMDYVFRRLALDHLDFETRSFMGIHTAEERARQLETGSYEANDADGESDEEIEDELENLQQSAPVTKKPEPRKSDAKVEDKAAEVNFGAGAASARVADVEVHSSAELLEKFGDQVRIGPYLGVYYCYLNLRKEPWNNPDVRRAISMAIDREFLADRVWGGAMFPAYGIVPPGIAGYAPYSAPFADTSEIDRQDEAARILQALGYGPDNPLKLELRYDGRPTGAGNAITGMRRVSRPGQRHYVPAKDVPKVRNGLGIAIISTSQGVMTDKEARNKGVGGEVLCEVW